MTNSTDKEYVFILNSIHRVMRAERLLKNGGIKFALMPVPRQLSSDCGLSIRYIGDDYNHVKDVLVEQFSDKVLAYQKAGEGYTKIL